MGLGAFVYTSLSSHCVFKCLLLDVLIGLLWLVKNFLVEEMAMFEDEGSEVKRGGAEHADEQNWRKHLYSIDPNIKLYIYIYQSTYHCVKCTYKYNYEYLHINVKMSCYCDMI